ncbi:hypothetical protein EXIGLDRAFT_624149 [Exidia glandulosa HHB12029]|uniref:Reverse transcriptase zinc-binding domain-containing protein n=1 Tax=Exidia glandulosa HHB12029 TaxID=1314781 RepID=A0A165DGI3_EXIGL|nr:hypothetical protein EXIGLDRAFT_624149 [Exidia glandulosa HHB12029]
MQHIDPDLAPGRLRRLLLSRRRQQASAIIQLRIGHAPLNKHLHRIDASDTDKCPACRTRPETARHYIMRCPGYELERKEMFARAGRGRHRMKELLSTKDGIAQLLRYIDRTGRLRTVHGAGLAR